MKTKTPKNNGSSEIFDFEDFDEESESEESEIQPDSSEANTPVPEAEKVEEDNNIMYVLI